MARAAAAGRRRRRPPGPAWRERRLQRLGAAQRLSEQQHAALHAGQQRQGQRVRADVGTQVAPARNAATPRRNTSRQRSKPSARSARCPGRTRHPGRTKVLAQASAAWSHARDLGRPPRRESQPYVKGRADGGMCAHSPYGTAMHKYSGRAAVCRADSGSAGPRTSHDASDNRAPTRLILVFVLVHRRRMHMRPCRPLPARSADLSGPSAIRPPYWCPVAGVPGHPRLGGSPMKRFTHNARRITAVAAVVGAIMLAPAIARASAGSPARPYAIAVTPLCQTPGLVIWLDTTGNGAAGTTFYKLHFTNLSGHACSLNGFPFLFAVNLTGHQVGPRAVFRLPPTPHLVTLANGKTATAVLGIVDTGVFSRSACRPVTAAGLRVFPPNQNQVQAGPVPLQYLLASARAGLAQRGSGYQIAPRRAICRLCHAPRKNRYGGQAPRLGPVRGAGAGAWPSADRHRLPGHGHARSHRPGRGKPAVAATRWLAVFACLDVQLDDAGAPRAAASAPLAARPWWRRRGPGDLERSRRRARHPAAAVR